ncbi:hypothetical protein M408DRAFT_330442 [Serendipita vermifera MAFF 305830]|uniref:Tyrosinase copper-binding domain-containing protein n=1 Tax=Serendipita vermifera MAFF 305830 TaxID=933852 RepID=A0A0C3B3A9_SERVB|nr:hypothetical protein M408DRAFT_330442 [Serendipita vermifera MAFF 305830]
MASTRKLAVASFALLCTISSLGLPLARAETVSRRAEPVPFLDYAGIESAASDAVASDLVRRGLADSSAAYAHIARSQNEGRTATPRCRTIEKRKEWRQLNYWEKKDYMRAIKCLQTKWDYGISPVSNTMYDAFTQVHQTNWTDFHLNAYFMPWHRWFVWVHAEAMSNLCGYHGPTPYWNYSLDYKKPLESPIFSSDHEVGFGSHGSKVINEIGSPGFKVDNGAFANFRVNLPKPHYLTRNFSYWKDSDTDKAWGYQLGESFSPKQVAIAMQKKTYWDFEMFVDGLNVTNSIGLHNGPHFFNMGDWNGPGWLQGTEWYPQGSTAPNDPMFWPHHAYMDSIFWSWQQKPGRQYLFGGSKAFWNLTDDTALPTDKLPFHGLGPDIPVALTLKTESWPLCYTY